MRLAISLSSLLLAALSCLSCMKTEVLNAPEVEQADAVRMYKPHRPQHPSVPLRDTTEVDDTARVPIGWNPSVEDWEEQETNF